MRKLLLVSTVMLGAVACSSETEGGGGGACADISGNWQLNSTKTGGSCTTIKNDEGASTFTMRKDADGIWNAVLPGLNGSCPGDLNTSTCKFVANCNITSSDSKVVASFGIEWTFNGGSLSGSEIAKFFPPAVASVCENTYQDTGKKL